MNNYCRNCGEKITSHGFCDKCGTKIINTRVIELNKELNRKYKIIFLGTFFLLLIIFFISNVIYPIFNYNILDFLFSIERLIGLSLIIFIIYAKRKLKVSKFFNIIFWLMLILFIIFIVFIILLLLSCEYTF